MKIEIKMKRAEAQKAFAALLPQTIATFSEEPLVVTEVDFGQYTSSDITVTFEAAVVDAERNSPREPS